MSESSFFSSQAPADWSIAPLGTHFVARSEIVSDRDFQPLSVTKNGVVPQLSTAAKTDNNDSRKLVREGDFVINSRSDRKGSGGISPLTGSVSTVYTVLTPRSSVDPSFAHHLLRSEPFQEEYYRWGAGIVADLWSTRYGAMKRIPLALPPLSVQTEIADYLDRETAQIDTLIAEQQRLIDILAERKLSVVDELVAAHGWRPQHPDDYATALPGGWRSAQLGQVLRQLTNGYVGPTRDILVDSGVRYIQGTHIKDGSIDFDRRHFFVSPEWHDARSRIHLGAGDVLVVQTGDIGRVAVVPDDFGEASCHALLIARPNTEIITGDFLAWFLRSHIGYQSLLSRATGALHPHLERGIRSVRLPVPPIDLQRIIASEADLITRRVNALIQEVRRLIQLAQERRAALITAAVTGQIEIPGVN